jgi:hypothetical protein
MGVWVCAAIIGGDTGKKETDEAEIVPAETEVLIAEF